MKCNNAIARHNNGHYSLTIPEYKQKEKEEVLKEAVEKYNGYVHIEISRVKKPKSVEANRLFHALVTEYYKSNLHSCNDWQELKNQLKYRFGEGFIHTVKLPDGNSYGILKSVADYTSKELSNLTDGTIRDMIIKGVDTKKFKEILKEIGFEIR